MNRINQKLEEDKKILSIYFTAGYPNLNDTVKIIEQLENSGVDMVEIGLPFSDPLADGPTIQASSTKALNNGMTTEILFEQLKDVRKKVSIPLLLMGYFNPILQYDVERFCKKCAEIGIDGLIIPDLPIDVYEEECQAIFEKYNLLNTFLNHLFVAVALLQHAYSLFHYQILLLIPFLIYSNVAFDFLLNQF